MIRLVDALAIPEDERAAFMAVSRFRRPRSSPTSIVPYLGPPALPPPYIELVGRDQNLGAVTALPRDTAAGPIEMTG